MSSRDRLMSLRVTAFGVTRAVASVSTSFLFKAGEESMVWLDHSLFFHLSVDGHVGCFRKKVSLNPRITAVTRAPLAVSLHQHFLSSPLGSRVTYRRTWERVR